MELSGASCWCSACQALYRERLSTIFNDTLFVRELCVRSLRMNSHAANQDGAVQDGCPRIQRTSQEIGGPFVANNVAVLLQTMTHRRIKVRNRLALRKCGYLCWRLCCAAC